MRVWHMGFMQIYLFLRLKHAPQRCPIFYCAKFGPDVVNAVKPALYGHQNLQRKLAIKGR